MKFPLFKKKEEVLLALDIGTETVKTLIFSTSACQKAGYGGSAKAFGEGGKKESEKIIIQGASFHYFDEFGVFDTSASSVSTLSRVEWGDSQDFEIIKKAISKILEEIQIKKFQFVLIGLPATILKARIAFSSFKRTNPKNTIDGKEEKNIYQQVLQQAKKEISQKFAKESGILPEDFHFLNLKILELKIDGYWVSRLQGYEGRNLDFRILAIFLPRYYLEQLGNIFKAFDLKKLKIVHEAQSLLLYLNEEPNGIFLDVGGEVTQIFLKKNGNLDYVNEFKIGGRVFSQALSEKLGLRELEARILKERYGRRELSLESQERIREIFLPEVQSWFKALKLKLSTDFKKPLPRNIFLFGGASLLPNIQEILEKGNWENLSFIDSLQVKFIYPKDFKNIEDYYPPTTLHIPPAHPKKEVIIQALNNPQFTPSLLLCYAQKNF